MVKLSSFMMISIDGCYADANGDMSWAHAGKEDQEYQEYVKGNTRGDGALVFGRKTYDLMVKYWPTELAVQQNPVVAKKMNEGRKFVVSRSMSEASWQNTTLIEGDLVREMQKLKAEYDRGLVIMGSGSLVAQLTDAGLVDAYTVVVVPLALGAGQRLFGGIGTKRPLSLTNTRSFANGKVVLSYVKAH